MMREGGEKDGGLVVDHVLWSGGELLVGFDDLCDGIQHVLLADTLTTCTDRKHTSLHRGGGWEEGEGVTGGGEEGVPTTTPSTEKSRHHTNKKA